jgi:hypothetical protein
MKSKVKQNAAYNDWNTGPSGPGGIPRSTPQRQRRPDNEYSDEDYDEGFEEKGDTNADDEMDRIKKAMAKEK